MVTRAQGGVAPVGGGRRCLITAEPPCAGVLDGALFALDGWRYHHPPPQPVELATMPSANLVASTLLQATRRLHIH